MQTMTSTKSRKMSEQDHDILLVKCRDYFREVDLNNDGTLCSSEFLNMIETIGCEYDVTKLRMAFELADTNKDGSISYREFIDAYTSPELLIKVDGGGGGGDDNKSVSTRKTVSRNNSRRSRKSSHPSRIEDDLQLTRCREYFRNLGNMAMTDDVRMTSQQLLNVIETIAEEMDVSKLRKAHELVTSSEKRDVPGISYQEFVNAFLQLSPMSLRSESVVLRRSRSDCSRTRTRSDLVLARCREYFTEMDLNHDGTLCSKEFLNMINIIGMELDVTVLRRAFDIADQNKDGTISYREFIDAYTRELQCVQHGPPIRPSGSRRSSNRRSRNSRVDLLVSMCREYFQEMDTNGDGKLNAGEFAAMVKHLGLETYDVQELTHAYKTADKDHDGTISFEEFLDAFTHRNPPLRNAPNSPNDTSAAHDMQISEKDLQNGCRYFWESDLDCDGKLTFSEFSAMLKALGMKLNQRDVSKAFKVADVDNNGIVGFGEFVRAYLNKMTSKTLTNQQVKDIFHKNDVCNEGLLTKLQFGQALRALGSTLEESRLDKYMSLTCKNQDGRVTLNEFCVFLDIGF